jgi:hypothetical protein
MEKAAAYAVSALIVGFGVWILVTGLSSSAPRFMDLRRSHPHSGRASECFRSLAPPCATQDRVSVRVGGGPQ